MTADASSDALAHIARDVSPTFAAAAGGPMEPQRQALLQQLQVEQVTGPQRATFMAVKDHADFQACVETLKTDPDLASLTSGELGMGPMVFTRHGGSRVDVQLLPLAVMTAAASELAIRGLPLAPDNLSQQVVESLRQVKQAVAGESVPITALVAYKGVPIEPAQVIETPWGQLRRATLPTWMMPPRSFPFEHADDVSAVLVSTEVERIRLDHAAQPEIVPEPIEEARLHMEIATSLVPLALVLATAGDDPIRPAVLWQTSIQPWSMGTGWGSWRTSGGWRQRSAPLSADDALEIEHWSRLVSEHHHDKLALAGRRIVSAVSQRVNIEDVLVDAVVAWENMVGGAPETTFRTSAGMACLLDSGPSRVSLQKRLANIYAARSTVVHGSQDEWKWRLEKGQEKVGIDKVADAAVEAAVGAFKALIEDHHELIELDAGQRSAALLLGLDEPEESTD